MQKLKFITQLLFSWFPALFIGFIVVNVLCIFFYSPVGWLDTPQGVTKGINHPGAVSRLATEGFAKTKIDKYGRKNKDLPLESSYILVMGSSHVVGEQISDAARLTRLLNVAFKENDKLKVFSIAENGCFLPIQLAHFKYAIEAYPKASAVIIEIPHTDYNPQELVYAKFDSHYDKSQSAEKFYNLSLEDCIKIKVKEYFPLLSRIKQQYNTWKIKNDGSRINDSKIIDNLYIYYQVLSTALAHARADFNGPIVFVYHPQTSIRSDGSLELIYPNTWDVFKLACKNNNIDVIDLGPAFEKKYYSSHQLPYGFSNTTPGSGHMNEIGHRIAADAILSYLEEKI